MYVKEESIQRVGTSNGSNPLNIVICLNSVGQKLGDYWWNILRQGLEFDQHSEPRINSQQMSISRSEALNSGSAFCNSEYHLVYNTFVLFIFTFRKIVS